jgi:uncharacterized protein YjbI with pentapeptide repeats
MNIPFFSPSLPVSQSPRPPVPPSPIPLDDGSRSDRRWIKVGTDDVAPLLTDMNELDKSIPIDESVTQVIHQQLPNLNVYGYQVLDELAIHADGQRITYLAQDLHGDRLVVIKEWRASDGNSLSLDYATYLPKIESLQKLDLPQISRYLNSFATPTGFCLVREYCRGVAVSELGTLPPADIKSIARAVLKILLYLQQLRPIVIHQNIKPENIIVDTSEKLTVYLVDFGLQMTGSAERISGTSGFIAPEQLFNRQLTSATDIYSLGVTLICLLTGTPTAQAHTLLDKNHRPEFQHLLPDNLHPKFLAWLEKMVEPNYQRRYLDAASARNPIADLPTERPQLKIRDFSASAKGEWLRWGIAAGILIGLALILRQFVFTDPGESEINPAELARNQALTKQAAFAESDRGKLIKEKQCVSCNLSNQDFTKAELSGVSLNQSSLIGANFANANLSLAIFRDADLSQANFRKTNLSQAAFYGAKSIGTDFTGANLSKAKLVYAKLKGALLRNANLANADLKFAELQQVDLTGANLTHADLSNTDLSYANLRHANLTGANLAGATLTGATMPDGVIHQ